MHDTLKALRALQARFHIRDDLPFEEWRGIIEAGQDTDAPDFGRHAAPAKDPDE